MSSERANEGARVHDVVAGYLATFAIFLAGLAVVYRPVRLAPVAIVVALVAVAMSSGRNEGLTRAAVIAGIAGWLIGMTAAVIADTPLW